MRITARVTGSPAKGAESGGKTIAQEKWSGLKSAMKSVIASVTVGAGGEAVKSQVPYYFDEWLTLMERAHEDLTQPQFRELEEKMKSEIAFHRKRHGRRRTQHESEKRSAQQKQHPSRGFGGGYRIGHSPGSGRSVYDTGDLSVGQ